jgi:hypothetical protein
MNRIERDRRSHERDMLAMIKSLLTSCPAQFTIQATIRSCPQEPGNQADIFKS